MLGFEKMVTTARYYECGEFLDARASRTLDLWHPVKNRSCVLDALDRDDRQAAVHHDATLSVRERSIQWAERFKRWEDKEERNIARVKARERAARIATIVIRDRLNLSDPQIELQLGGYASPQ